MAESVTQDIRIEDKFALATASIRWRIAEELTPSSSAASVRRYPCAQIRQIARHSLAVNFSWIESASSRRRWLA